MVAVRDQGKTAFVRDVLTKNNQANPKAVNEAWSAAGHEGSISTTLVNKIRSEMGLVGNLRSRPKSTESEGAAEQPSAAPEVRRRGAGSKKAGGRGAVKANGRHAPEETVQQSKPQAAGDDRIRVLKKLEGNIDEMIFEIKGVGGLPEFEEILRRARRILARSHEE
jgi:hypothetical protein